MDLKQFFNTANPGTVSIGSVNFGPSGVVMPSSYPLGPQPTGTLGGNQPDFSKLARFPPVELVVSRTRQLLKF